MFLKNSKIAFAVFIIFFTGIGLFGGYFLKSYWNKHNAPTVQMSWAKLEEGYHAVKDKDNEWSRKGSLDQLNAITGENISLFGYMLPIEATETHRHFLFSPRNHSCPFCMPANAGNLIEVFTDNDMSYRNEPFQLEGTFNMKEDEHSPLIYSMANAHAVE